MSGLPKSWSFSGKGRCCFRSAPALRSLSPLLANGELLWHWVFSGRCVTGHCCECCIPWDNGWMQRCLLNVAGWQKRSEREPGLKACCFSLQFASEGTDLGARDKPRGAKMSESALYPATPGICRTLAMLADFDGGYSGSLAHSTRCGATLQALCAQTLDGILCKEYQGVKALGRGLTFWQPQRYKFYGLEKTLCLPYC